MFDSDGFVASLAMAGHDVRGMKVVLAGALLACDFSVRYVAENEHSRLPAVYRFCAAWTAADWSSRALVCRLNRLTSESSRSMARPASSRRP